MLGIKPTIRLLVFLTIPIMGCTQRLGDFTFLSTKNVDYSNLDLEAAKNEPIVEGEDAKAIIFIFQAESPHVEEAIDRAIESHEGTALIDAVVYHTTWYIPLIIGEDKFHVRGKVVAK